MTVYRNDRGELLLRSTVASVVNELAKNNAGYIKVDTIQAAINDQLPESEWVSRDMVMVALAELLRKHNHIFT